MMMIFTVILSLAMIGVYDLRTELKWFVNNQQVIKGLVFLWLFTISIWLEIRAISQYPDIIT